MNQEEESMRRRNHKTSVVVLEGIISSTMHIFSLVLEGVQKKMTTESANQILKKDQRKNLLRKRSHSNQEVRIETFHPVIPNQMKMTNLKKVLIRIYKIPLLLIPF